MSKLTTIFLKVFFRNRRAIVWVVALPALIFLSLAVLESHQVVRFDVSGSYQDFLLPGVIAFAILQTGVYTTAYTLLDFKRGNVLKRLAVTPVRPSAFIFSHMLARFVMGLLMVLLLVAVGMWLFDTRLDSRVLLLPVVVFFGNWIFTGFGFAIAALARDYEEAAPYSSAVGLGLSFVGDVFFSSDNLPGLLPAVADFLPLKPFAALLRYSILGSGSGELVQDTVVFLVWFVVATALAALVFRRLILQKNG